jgi:hypothetical protein
MIDSVKNSFEDFLTYASDNITTTFNSAVEYFNASSTEQQAAIVAVALVALTALATAIIYCVSKLRGPGKVELVRTDVEAAANLARDNLLLKTTAAATNNVDVANPLLVDALTKLKELNDAKADLDTKVGIKAALAAGADSSAEDTAIANAVTTLKAKADAAAAATDAATKADGLDKVIADAKVVKDAADLAAQDLQTRIKAQVDLINPLVGDINGLKLQFKALLVKVDTELAKPVDVKLEALMDEAKVILEKFKVKQKDLNPLIAGHDAIDPSVKAQATQMKTDLVNDETLINLDYKALVTKLQAKANKPAVVIVPEVDTNVFTVSKGGLLGTSGVSAVVGTILWVKGFMDLSSAAVTFGPALALGLYQNKDASLAIGASLLNQAKAKLGY